ncbi:MAG: recombinase family protein [Clostridia bacterium]|nr:recombinase family protein [Clostridia bacterium]
MKQKTYGYARVSSTDQNVARQLIELEEYGVQRNMIFVDHWTGKTFERPGYQQMIKTLQEGDELVILSVDRLGRDYKAILNEWRFLKDDKKVKIIILDSPILNTSDEDDLIYFVIQDIILQLKSFMAENERVNIAKRQEQGIAAAQMRGVRFGRPKMEIPEEFWSIKARWEANEITSRQAGALLDISHVTFLLWVKRSS